MAINLDNLQIDIVVNAAEAAASLGKLQSALKGTAKGSTVPQAAEQIQDLGTATAEATTQTEKLEHATEQSGKSLGRVANFAKSARASLADFALRAAESGGALSKLGTAIIDLNNNPFGTLLKGAWNLGKSITNTFAIKPLKSFGAGLASIAGRLSTMLAAVKRIAFYRLIRSSIKMITQALSEGVKTLIAWDREWGNNTSRAAETADTITAKWAEVKKSIGAAAMPLIQILQPALMSVMQTVINVANAINQVLRSLQGYSTYMKATTQAIGAGIDSATGRAKELKRVLFSFDELNVLPSDTGSGGGAASATTSPIDFVETDIEKLFDIDESGRSLGTRLANMLNNALANFDAYAFGERIAEKVNKGIHFAFDFLTTFNFSQLGAKIASVINGIFETVDFATLGQTVARWITALPETIVGLIENLNFGAVGSAIGTFLTNALNGLSNWLNSKNWVAFGQTLSTKIADFIRELNVVEVASALIKFLWSVVKAVIPAIWGLIRGLWNSFVEDIENVLGVNLSRIKFNIEPANKQTQEILQTMTEDERSLTLNINASEATTEVGQLVQTLNEDGTISVKVNADQKCLNKTKKTTNNVFEDIGYFALGVSKKLEKGFWGEDGILGSMNKFHNELAQKMYESGEITRSEYESMLRSGDGTYSELTSKVSEHARNASTKFNEIGKDYKQSQDDMRSYAKKHPVEIPLETDNPTEKIYNPVVDAISGAAQYADSNKITARQGTSTFNFANEVSNAINDAQKTSDKSPVIIKTLLGTAGLGTNLAYTIGQLQKGLNNGQGLTIPIKTSSNPVSPTAYKDYLLEELSDSRINTRGFASGGVPDVGTLFFAGEAGAEVVANMSNGRTGVMNVEQMENAVAAGNENVVAAIFQAVNAIIPAINNKDTNVYISEAAIGQAANRYNNNQVKRGVNQGALNYG